ncbi:hypothetical protein KUCAC02_015860, partial [Chaenocephalus aceratus]
RSLTMTLGESFRSNEPENAEPPLPFILLSTTLSHRRDTATSISEGSARLHAQRGRVARSPKEKEIAFQPPSAPGHVLT